MEKILKLVNKHFPGFLDRILIDGIIIGFLALIVAHNWDDFIRENWSNGWINLIVLLSMFVVYIIVKEKINKK